MQVSPRGKNCKICLRFVQLFVLAIFAYFRSSSVYGHGDNFFGLERKLKICSVPRRKKCSRMSLMRLCLWSFRSTLRQKSLVRISYTFGRHLIWSYRLMNTGHRIHSIGLATHTYEWVWVLWSGFSPCQHAGHLIFGQILITKSVLVYYMLA